MRAHRESSPGLRDRILAEATRLFAHRGFSGTSMRELVEACECTKPALYYYFDGKESLFREVLTIHTSRIEAILRSGCEGTGPLRQRIHDMTDRFVEYGEGNPDALRLVIRLDASPEENSPECTQDEQKSSHFDIFQRMFAQGIENGEVRAGLDPMDCALALSGALHYQFAEAVMTSTWDRARYHRLVDLVFEGIAP